MNELLHAAQGETDVYSSITSFGDRKPGLGGFHLHSLIRSIDDLLAVQP
jgi:hypothetical protein